jgi:glycosyltransferase involved in cell wall biosynthesis
MIEHLRTGYLARPFEADDLARGIAWVIEDEERRMMLSANARAKAETEFELETIARRYAQLYEDLLAA